ncbi:hypothetical protein Ciccas_014608, partial [Cichlidogyrus casuarinus]
MTVFTVILLFEFTFYSTFASQEFEGASLNFGEKGMEAGSLSFNELFYEIDVGRDSNRGILNAAVEFLNLEFEGLATQESSKFTAPPYYVPKSRGYHEYQIPGHSLTKDGNFDKVHAEYAFNAKNTQLASVTLTKAVKFAGSDESIVFGPDSKMFDWDTGLPAPSITEYNYDKRTGYFKFHVTLQEVEQSRTFIRILGPTVKGSLNDLRGIVYKYDRESAVNLYKEIEMKELIQEQLGFIEKLKAAGKTEDLGLMYEKNNDDYKYK